jgi:hypothetical protein
MSAMLADVLAPGTIWLSIFFRCCGFVDWITRKGRGRL